MSLTHWRPAVVLAALTAGAAALSVLAPQAAARSAGADIGCDLSVGAKGEPDQLLARRRPPREDAGALCYMRI